METEQNRAQVLWRDWLVLENDLMRITGKSGEYQEALARQKYEFLSKGLYRLTENKLLAERPYVAMMTAVTDQLQRQLYPNRMMRWLHQAKVLLYDRPKFLDELQQRRAANVSSLKSTFERRGLEGIAKLLDHYLDYEKQQVSFTVVGKLDENRTLNVDPVFDQDQNGAFSLSALNLKLRGSADPAKDLAFSLPGEFLLNRQQLVNLIEQRAVYVFPANDQESGSWLRLENGQDGALKLAVEHDHTDTLKTRLYELAEQTQLYKLSSSEVLLNLKLGNQYRMNGLHPQNKRFFVEAHPSGKEVIIRNEFGKEISKDELLRSLQHQSPERAGSINLSTEVGRSKDRPDQPEQGLAV